MIRVKIRLLGGFKEVTGKSEEVFLFAEKVDVLKVIYHLVEKHGEELKKSLLDPVIHSPQPNALIFLNGVEINNLEGLNTAVEDESTIIILAVTHGG